jgi:hypothetical protein
LASAALGAVVRPASAAEGEDAGGWSGCDGDAAGIGVVLAVMLSDGRSVVVGWNVVMGWNVGTRGGAT